MFCAVQDVYDASDARKWVLHNIPPLPGQLDKAWQKEKNTGIKQN